MRVWRWRVYFKDARDERITDRALAGVWLSKSSDDDTVQDEIHDYLSGELELDPEDIYRLDIWDDGEKYELG
jgi:hypothetical protein